MDKFLQQACAVGSKPFDGLTLRPKDLLPLTQLSSLLATTVAVLRNEFPAAELLRHADWHEHDGYVSGSVASNWADLEAIVASPEDLYASRPGDDLSALGSTTVWALST